MIDDAVEETTHQMLEFFFGVDFKRGMFDRPPSRKPKNEPFEHLSYEDDFVRRDALHEEAAGGFRVVGDPTEGALVEAAAKTYTGPWKIRSGGPGKQLLLCILASSVVFWAVELQKLALRHKAGP